MHIKQIILVLFVLGSVLCFSQTAISIDKLYKNKQGLYIDTLTGQTYTGQAFQKFESDTIGMKGSIVDGLFHETWTWWYSTGEKKRETNYNLGNKDGYSYWWYKNGVMRSEIKFSSNRNVEQRLWDKEGRPLPNPKMHMQ